MKQYPRTQCVTHFFIYSQINIDECREWSALYTSSIEMYQACVRQWSTVAVYPFGMTTWASLFAPDASSQRLVAGADLYAFEMEALVEPWTMKMDKFEKLLGNKIAEKTKHKNLVCTLFSIHFTFHEWIESTVCVCVFSGGRAALEVTPRRTDYMDWNRRVRARH